MIIEALMVFTIHAASYHIDPTNEPEEFNPGVGIQYQSYRADMFRDSYGNIAGGISKRYSYGPFSFDVGVMKHTEYTGPIIVPSVKIGRARIGILPSEKSDAVMTLSFEF